MLNRIFVSYSHRGNGPKWKFILLQALKVFEQHHFLDVWQDGKIRISSFWDDDIKKAMHSANLAVVLITKESLESEYILSVELPILSERQKIDKLPVFPVICEPCDWQSIDWLRATQSPNNSNPLSELSPDNQENVFRKLATTIAKELSVVTRSGISSIESIDDKNIYLNKFPISSGSGLREDKLIGREQELALLDLAFSQPYTAIVSLVAWGGVGKSMLVRHWLKLLEQEKWLGCQRVYGWSFFSQGSKEDRQASEDTFLAHSLDWFGIKCEPTLSPWEKGRLLADEIVKERTLLILDGIEPLQYPPGPMGGQLRAPGVQCLLKQLARRANKSEHNGLCIVTTREPLTDLSDYQRRQNSAWGSVLRIDLENLTKEAGATLLHHNGATKAGAAEIKADDSELISASEEVDGHGLTLNLLGSFIARAHGGDIRQRDLVRFEEADIKEQGGTTFKMLAAFESWFARSGEFGARQLAILRILGLFDRPADAGCIGALREAPVIQGLTDPLFTMRSDENSGQMTLQPILEEDWNTATSFLAEFGLLDKQTNAEESAELLDCHPLIREYFGTQCKEKSIKSWKSSHLRIYEYLINSTVEKPETLEGLQPLYQAVVHGCYAGLSETVRTEIYRDRILRGPEHYSWHKLGAFSEELSAQLCFFIEPWSIVMSDITDSGQAWLFNEVACCLRSLGRLTEAIEPFVASVSRANTRKDWLNATIHASNLSELQLQLGEIGGAIRNAQKCIEYANNYGDIMELSINLTVLAEAMNKAGNQVLALQFFKEAEALQAICEQQYPLLYSLQGFRYCDLLLAEAERAAWWASMFDRISLSDMYFSDEDIVSFEIRCGEVFDRCLKISDWGCDSLLDLALINLTLGRGAIYSAVLERYPLRFSRNTLTKYNVHKWLSNTMGFLCRSHQQGYINCGLLASSWLSRLDGDNEGAQADLDEAWDIAERGPMRLHMADIHLYRARLFFREDKYPWDSPQADLIAAEKLINDCGYHRRDEELADAKKVIMGI